MEAALKTREAQENQTRTEVKPLLAGIATGQIAGLIMAVVVMLVFAVVLGKSPLFPVQVIGSTLFGESSLNGFHLGALLAGLLLHQLGPSLLWGTIFGVAATKLEIRTKQTAVILGLGIGVVSMVGPYLLIPFVMNTLQGKDLWAQEVPIFWDWAAHIVFGASFVLYPVFQKKLQRK